MPGDELEVKVDDKTSPDPKDTSVEDQIRVAALKGRSDALADVNRIKAEAEKALKAAQAADSRVTQMLKDYEEDIRDDPDKLNAFRTRQAKQAADTELAKLTQELDEAKGRLSVLDTEKKQTAIEKTTQDIAARFGVDTARLLKLAKFTDGTTEAMEEIAKDLPKVNAPKLPSSFDSNRASGGNLSEEQIRKTYRENPDNPKARADYLSWRQAKGI